VKRRTHRGNAQRVPDALDRHVGARIQLRRLQLGMTRERVAKVLRLGPSRIALIESGVVSIRSRWLDLLCDLFDVQPSYFFRGYVPIEPAAATAPLAATREETMLGRALTVASCLAMMTCAAEAEIKEVTLVRQPAFAFLPIVLMQTEALVEKHAREAGLGEIKVNYVSMNNGAAVNDGLLSRTVQIAAGGLPPFLTMWDRTQGGAGVKALRAVSDSQQYLVTRNPNVRTVADFGENDRINVQAPGAAMPSILLQMAAAQAFGIENYAKLDRLMVGLSGPDAVAALLSEKGQITADFASAPFSYQELDAPGNHLVLKARDLTGGRVTTVFLYASSAFYDENPKTVVAILSAYDEAVTMIEKDRRAAAEAFLKVDGKYPLNIGRMIDDPTIGFQSDPHGILKFADFMHQIGLIKSTPGKWQDTFFAPEAERLHGD
jgi:NitT/TauT family transport system substrate-binding protein